MLIPVRLRMYIVLLERAKHVGALVKMAIINIRLPSKSLQQRLLAVSLCQESGETKADSTLNDKVSFHLQRVSWQQAVLFDSSENYFGVSGQSYFQDDCMGEEQQDILALIRLSRGSLTFSVCQAKSTHWDLGDRKIILPL
jgi:hypothetical protein